MLSPRIYNILEFFSKQSEPLSISETDFDFIEIAELINDGYLSETAKSYCLFEGAIPGIKKAYEISPKGRDALLLHDEELQRMTEASKISKRSLNWTKATFWITAVSLLITILSLLITIVPR